MKVGQMGTRNQRSGKEQRTQMHPALQNQSRPPSYSKQLTIPQQKAR